ILRISSERQVQTIRCPKCRWEKKIWLHKKDQLASLMNQGEKDFESGDFEAALRSFREAETLDRTFTLAYCHASRCLKKMGRKQDAIRELQKILSIIPEDAEAQNEMKGLIYN